MPKGFLKCTFHNFRNVEEENHSGNIASQNASEEVISIKHKTSQPGVYVSKPK